MSELCCHEFNTIANTGSTVLDKWGLSVVQTANDAVSGSRNDAAVRIVNQAGATNWKMVFNLVMDLTNIQSRLQELSLNQ